jgi:hypothetical protein
LIVEISKTLSKENLAELLRRSLVRSRLSYRAAAIRVGIASPATFTRVMKLQDISDIAFVRILTFIHLELNMDYNSIMEFLLITNYEKENKNAKAAKMV